MRIVAVLGCSPPAGNDFARVLGWQKFNAVRPYAKNFFVLRKLVKAWLSAKIVYHDIWEVVLKVEPEGTFQKIDSISRRKVKVYRKNRKRNKGRTDTRCC